MLALIFLTFGVFFVMWLGDLYLTIKTVKRVGPEAELNPVIRKFLKFRGKFIWLFKIIELGAFLYLIYYLTTFTGVIPFYVLLGYIFFYGMLVANNSRVYYEITGEESRALTYLFVALVVISILFIYLNYMIYTDLTTSFSALSECHSSYADLYENCELQNATTTETTLPEDLMKTLKDLNLSVPRGRWR